MNEFAKSIPVSSHNAYRLYKETADQGAQTRIKDAIKIVELDKRCVRSGWNYDTL